MTIQRLLLTGMLILLFGCAATPPRQPAPDNSRIGAMVLVDTQAKHVHMGTTAFADKSFPDVSDWEVPSLFINHIKDRLDGKRGFQVIEIDATPELLEQADSMVGYWSGKFNAELEPLVASAIEGQSLDFLVTLEPFSMELGYGTYASISGYGALTRCIFKACGAQTFGYVITRVYALNPIRLYANGKAVHERFPIDPDLTDVRSGLTAEQIEEGREPVLSAIIEIIDSGLTNAGLVE